MPCKDQLHPQVPITVTSVTVVYCHSCQSWRIMGGLSTQSSDEDHVYELWNDHELGPFDCADDAYDQAIEFLDEALLGSGRPWDHQRREPTSAGELDGDADG